MHAPPSCRSRISSTTFFAVRSKWNAAVFSHARPEASPSRRGSGPRTTTLSVRERSCWMTLLMYRLMSCSLSASIDPLPVKRLYTSLAEIQYTAVPSGSCSTVADMSQCRRSYSTLHRNSLLLEPEVSLPQVRRTYEIRHPSVGTGFTSRSDIIIWIGQLEHLGQDKSHKQYQIIHSGNREIRSYPLSIWEVQGLKVLRPLTVNKPSLGIFCPCPGDGQYTILMVILKSQRDEITRLASGLPSGKVC